MTAAAVEEMSRLRLPLVALTALLSAAYVVFGLRPEPPAAVAGVSDIIVHGAGYAVLSFLATATAVAFNARRPLVLGAVYALAHGILLELLQLAVPIRAAEVKDVLVDAVAALVGALPWLWRKR